MARRMGPPSMRNSIGTVIDISQRRRSVFISYRFEDSELANDLVRLLKYSGFEPITGKLASGYVSEAILKDIQSCSLFLALMTRDERKADGTYTTSPWILQEVAAARALGKPMVIMVQENVSRIGGFAGDLQLLPFTEKGFLRAALDAVELLESYCAPISKDTGRD